MKKQLASLINNAARADQEMLKKYREGKKWNETLIRENTNLIKEIVKNTGWPTINLVGKKASFNAWLIVQHAGHDIPFQKKCLRLMKVSYRKDKKNIEGRNIAFLTDRILVEKKKPQLFGTQFHSKKLKLFPIKNPAQVNARRAKFGMETLEEFLAEINKS